LLLNVLVHYLKQWAWGGQVLDPHPVTHAQSPEFLLMHGAVNVSVVAWYSYLKQQEEHKEFLKKRI
jgi:hypothetical protein